MLAFAWWVNHTPKKEDVIIASVRQRIAKTSHKYGIEDSTDWKYTQAIDKKNGNQLWCDSLIMEMKNVGVAFDVLEDYEELHVGWTKASGYLIWGVKMDFTRKAR